MKKLSLSLLIFLGITSAVFSDAKFIITSKLDDKSMPTDRLTDVPFDKDHEYLMFVYEDDNTAFGVEKVYFEISTYDADAGKYKYEDLYTVATKTDWGYCYKGINFNVPGKFRVRVFTNNGDLVTRYIDVVDK